MLLTRRPMAASTRFETLGVGTGVGTTVTAGAANTKGSYATIGTTGFAYDGMHVHIGGLSGTTRYRIDIAANNTVDTIIVPDICFDTTGGAGTAYTTLDLPISVPSGAVIKAACQTTPGSSTCMLLLNGYKYDSKGRGGFSRCISLTDWTNSDPTGSVTLNGTTQTGWATVAASSSGRVAALLATISYLGGTITGTHIIVDIGFGAAASERVISRFHLSGNNIHQAYFGPFRCDFPAGTRFAFRAQANTGNTNVIGMSLLGIAA